MLPATLRRERHQCSVVPSRDDPVARDRWIPLPLRRHLHQDVQALFGLVHRELDSAFVIRHDTADNR